jgi:hypothetical protein
VFVQPYKARAYPRVQYLKGASLIQARGLTRKH